MVKKYPYKKLVDIRELLEQLPLDLFNNPFTTDTRTLKNIPLIDEIDDEETVST